MYISKLIVRFLFPSPVVESTLPIYTHSPIVDPVVLYSPSRPNATPAAPAIRLHPSSAATRSPRAGGARFADDTDPAAGTGKNETGAPVIHNNVTFQTRPRGNTADSTSSFAYPTFAAYRQAQHVNFDAFAQRVKRAFALSQQQQEEERQREIEAQELQKQQDELKQQENQQRPTNSRSNSTSAIPSSTLSNPPVGGRSRSSSAASMIGDFTERLKSGKLFRKSSNISLRATAVANAASSGTGTDVGTDVQSKRSSQQLLKSNNDSDVLLTPPLAPSGIEIMVTPSEDDHPSTDDAVRSDTTAIQTGAAKASI
ncbi:hypothetical protein FBU30_008609 [Linnemannia zychae]|nr:hypothetical protein FBU30_008609 [Linnemannia zychae]